MAETLTERLTNTPEKMRRYQQERASLELTELICEAMHAMGATAESMAFVKQLDNRLPMTIAEASGIFHALGKALHFSVGPLET